MHNGTEGTYDAGSTGMTPDDAALEKLQAQVQAVIPEGVPGGVAALVVRDGTTLQAVNGTADADGTALAIDATFNIASVSKMYTATLIYQLEDQGLLDTSAPLSSILPRAEYDDGVTVDTMLSHRSGIPDYAANPQYLADILADPEHIFTTDELIDYSTFDDPAPPGQAYAYSNTGYLWLGLVIEHVTGTSLAQALDDGIITPLSLTSTSLIDPPDFLDTLAQAWLDPTAFGLPEDTPLPIMPVPGPFSGCQADCGILTTPAELRTFVEALFDGTLVSEAALAKMTKSEADAPHQGRGVEIYEWDDHTHAYGHAGGGVGYTSLVAYAPSSGDITIVMATNDAFDLTPLLDAYSR